MINKSFLFLIFLSLCALGESLISKEFDSTKIRYDLCYLNRISERYLDGQSQWNEWDVQFLLSIGQTIEEELTSTYDEHFLLYAPSMAFPLYKQFWYKNLVGKDLGIKTYDDVILSDTDEIIEYEGTREESLSVKKDGLNGTYSSVPEYDAGWDHKGYIEYYELTGCYRYEYSYNGDLLSKHTYYRIDTVTLEKSMDGYREYYYKDSKPSYYYYFYKDSLGDIIKDDSTAYITVGDTTYVTKFNIDMSPVVPEGRHRYTERSGKLTSHLYQRFNPKTEKWETPYELSTYHYNDNGLCTSIIEYKGPDTLSPPTSRVDFDYNKDGNRLKSTYFKFENEQWVLNSSSALEYNQDGNITTFPFYGDMYEIQYENNLPSTIIGGKEVDSAGKIHAKYVRHITFSSNEDNGILKNHTKGIPSRFQLSSEKLTISTIVNQPLYLYNMRGQLVHTVVPNIVGESTIFNLQSLNLASGMYTLKLKSSEVNFNKNILIK